VAAWYLWRAVELHKAGKLPVPAVKTRIKQVKKQAAVRRAKNTLKRARKVLARRARQK
jgi:hypothetical protein